LTAINARLQPDPDVAVWRVRLYRLIFEADTPGGKLFDVVLLVLILLSVAVICLESVIDNDESLERYRYWLIVIEWVITIAFTFEYFARIACVQRPSRYIFSFFGIIDLLAILPTWIAFAIGGGNTFVILRAIRLLRVFRVLKLVWLVHEADELGAAIWRARGKVLVFLIVVGISVTISGAVMYELEKHRNAEQFSSIPAAMYWAIVTMTTVGYGDMVPQTGPGKAFSALLILLGYSLIIVPTGFVSAEFLHGRRPPDVTTRVCSNCMSEGHDRDARYCKYCAEKLL
jgi:voltage-gated potassium channel